MIFLTIILAPRAIKDNTAKVDGLGWLLGLVLGLVFGIGLEIGLRDWFWGLVFGDCFLGLVFEIGLWGLVFEIGFVIGFVIGLWALFVADPLEKSPHGYVLAPFCDRGFAAPATGAVYRGSCKRTATF